jgi:beta-lactamase regulating signal transducer with metallopeptidase domain
MNLGGLFLIFIVVVAAVMGLILISSQTTPATNITDTYGTAMSNTTNQSQAAVSNLTATGTQIGAGVLFLIVGIIGAIIFGLLILVATRKF